MPSIFLNPTIYDFHPYKAGSLPDHVNTTIKAMIAGLSPSPAIQRPYTANNFNASSPIVTRNQNCFLGNFDYAAIAQQNGTSQNFGCTLISPRHVVMAAHAPSQSPVVFMKADETLVSRSILATQEILPGENGDTAIGILSSTITDIAPAKILPTNYWQYVAGCGAPSAPGTNSPYLQYLYCLSRNGHRPDGVAEPSFNIIKFSSVLAFLDKTYATAFATPSGRHKSWQAQNIIGGDSGSQVFIPVNGNLVLLGKMYTGGGSLGFMITGQMKATVESVMNSLAVAQGDFTTYSLSEVDISGFVI